MESSTPHPMKEVTPGMRWILRVASVLVLIAGYQLFVLTRHTDRYFAWTVNPPLTAAFLGASYWASFVMVFQASRERYWANARVGSLSAFTFTTLTTIATFLHIDRFHFNSPDTITLVANWAWMIVYWFVPPILFVLLALQILKPGIDPERRAPLPSWLRWVLSLQGLAMLVVGAALFIAPKATLGHWPWLLTPLTARAVGAWLLGMAVAALAALRENDLARDRGAILCYAVLGLLQLVALVRFAGFRAPDTGQPILAWEKPAPWIYLAFWLGVFAVGVLALLALRKIPQERKKG